MYTKSLEQLSDIHNMDIQIKEEPQLYACGTSSCSDMDSSGHISYYPSGSPGKDDLKEDDKPAVFSVMVQTTRFV